MMWRGLILLVLPVALHAETLVATRTIRPQTILLPGDLSVVDGDAPDALTDHAEAVGLETRVTLYADRPIRASDLGAPAIIDRNQVVALSYTSGGLSIRAEGRSLARGGVGDVIRVMNLSSRTTVSGRIGSDGVVQVGLN